MTHENGRGASKKKSGLLRSQIRGIVVSEGRNSGNEGPTAPRISAFVWGDRVQPAPTLPFGRWGSAA